MKKLFFAVLVTLIGLAFTAPAFAIDHQFGGYWRVRMYTQKHFDGTSDSIDNADTTTYAIDQDPASPTVGTVVATVNDNVVDNDVAQADTRTHIYYTAVFSDNFKLVNKFEMDATWGVGGTSYGDIGADGIAVEVKNTYAEFTTGGGLFRIGTQGATISRGFVFSSDFSGLVAVVGPATMLYAKVEENDDNVGDDAAMYHAEGAFDLGAVKLTPGFTYVDFADSDEAWFLSFNVDHEIFWASFIYEGGDYLGLDISAWLLAAGASYNVNDVIGIHGQAFYATGDDDDTDGDNEAFTKVPGLTQSYYWSEIMGFGMFDNQASNGSCADAISNIVALNMGVTIAPVEKLTLSADLWYAQLVEDDDNGYDDLGVEVDLKATYELVDGLNLDVVAAMLFAGDATTQKAVNDENPWEIGTRLSLSF